MRIRKQSKVPALPVVCGIFFAGLLLSPSFLQAGQKPTVGASYRRATDAAAPARSDAVQPARSSVQAQINAIVKRVSNSYQVDPKLIHAMIRVESDYDPMAVSPKGAMGLMQLIPSTAQRFGVRNPFNLTENIQGGVSYLRYLLNLFGGNVPLSLAAYNAGARAVIRSGGVPAYRETEHYVREVTHLYHSKSSRPMAVVWPGEDGLSPIVRYVDSNGVVHFTNAD